jgi:transcriptional regulator with XRE-family HTH domain
MVATKRKRETVGARLRAARYAADLSQTQLAERSGIPKPTISRYENDHVLPSLPTLARLAKALDVPVAELVTDTLNGEKLIVEALRRRGVHVGSVAEAEHFVDLIEEDSRYRQRRRRRRRA